MTAREEILDAARRVSARSSTGEFSLEEIVKDLQDGGTRYAESTIRTHIVSKMCANAPDNHAVTYDDFVRTGHGVYRFR